MGETTLKIFALHYSISCVVVAISSKSKITMFSPYHVIMFGILLMTGFASILQMSEGENGLRKNQAKISKSNFDLNSY